MQEEGRKTNLLLHSYPLHNSSWHIHQCHSIDQQCSYLHLRRCPASRAGLWLPVGKCPEALPLGRNAQSPGHIGQKPGTLGQWSISWLWVWRWGKICRRVKRQWEGGIFYRQLRINRAKIGQAGHLVFWLEHEFFWSESHPGQDLDAPIGCSICFSISGDPTGLEIVECRSSSHVWWTIIS
jgi:hypothetical protein